jgi:hypothetical protein
MGLPERLEIYKKIEGHRKRPLMSYVTSKRDGVLSAMASDALPYLIEQLDALPAGTTELDFLIVSYGGDPMVAWRIMSLIRERVDKVFVLIPQSAYSAATLLALGGNEIVMHPNGHLGPIDMQITTVSEGQKRMFSTEDISAFVDFVRTDLAITDQKHLRRLFQETCREVGSLGVGFNARNQKLAITLAERLLNMPHPENDGGSHAIVESLSHQLHSHAYPVSRKEALNMGLPVNKDRDATLESLMWALWLDIEDELQERRPFDPVSELLNSDQKDVLLSDAPQLNLPENTQGSTHVSADLDGVSKASKTVKPIDFCVIDAIIESGRLACRGITKGKILAARQPNLYIRYNALVTFKGWEKRYPV